MKAITEAAAAALKIDRKRMPIEGVPPVLLEIQGLPPIMVRVAPSWNWLGSGSGKPHRLQAQCPICYKWISAGRMHQHLPACPPDPDYVHDAHGVNLKMGDRVETAFHGKAWVLGTRVHNSEVRIQKDNLDELWVHGNDTIKIG
jgi:hypothetical protein